jgi:hypothetical protein
MNFNETVNIKLWTGLNRFKQVGMAGFCEHDDDGDDEDDDDDLMP